MSILKKKSGFVKGLKLKENKKSSSIPIKVMPAPARVIIPMQQHLGAECEPIVSRGDSIKVGQLIGESSSFVSAKVHSSIDGIVKNIIRMVNPATSTLINAVEINADEKSQDNINLKTEISPIEANGNFAEILKKYIKIIDDKTPRSMIEKIREAGIVGMGGAAFPTHVKLSVPEGNKIDTVILNGCECEPYITADHRLMLEYSFEMLLGALIIFKILSPAQLIVAIEENKEDAADKLLKAITVLGLEDKFKIVLLPSKYPMGAEKTLIKNILGRTVPAGGLPLNVGVVVQNVATAKAIFDAVVLEKPLIERIITLTGDIDNPVNLMIKVGTLLTDIIDYFGRTGDKKYEVIFGGPMTGYSVGNLNFPITKGTNCILLKEVLAKQEGNCIRCSRCVGICPMNLVPLMYVNFVKNNKYEDCSNYYIENCIECGSCAYRCPASIPIVGYIKTGKAVLQRDKS